MDWFKVIIPFVAGVVVGAVGGPVGWAIAAGVMSGGAYAATQGDDILEGAMIGAAAGYGGFYTAGALSIGKAGAETALATDTVGVLTAKETVAGPGVQEGILAAGGPRGMIATPAPTPAPAPTPPPLAPPPAETGFSAWMNKNPMLAYAGFASLAQSAAGYATASSAEKAAKIAKEPAITDVGVLEVRKPTISPPTIRPPAIDWETQIAGIRRGTEGYKKGVLA